MNEIIFSAEYKEWRNALRFSFHNGSDSDVVYALSYIHKQIENRAFSYSGIDCALIEETVQTSNGLLDVIDILESKKPNEWTDFLLKTVKKKELLPAAKTKFICTLLSKNRISATISPEIITSSIKPEEQKSLGAKIAFIGQYKNWVAIKKISIDEKTNDYEVAGILSAINTTLITKSFDFLNPDKTMEAIASKVTMGKRSSFANLADALKQIFDSLTENKINNAYLIKCVFENLGFTPYANLAMLVPAYPELKMPKPKGRFKKS